MGNYRHYGAASPECRARLNAEARERAAAERERGRQEAEQRLAALRERVPEQLPQLYTIMFVSKNAQYSICTSDQLMVLQANSGFGPDTTRQMIDDGQPRKTLNGWIKIVPAESN